MVRSFEFALESSQATSCSPLIGNFIAKRFTVKWKVSKKNNHNSLYRDLKYGPPVYSSEENEDSCYSCVILGL